MSPSDYARARTTWNKLVRDGIPDIVLKSNMVPRTRILEENEFRAALKAKLVEEAQEASEAENDQLITELADLLEVIHALCKSLLINLDDVERERERRAAARGSFDQRLFLIETAPSAGVADALNLVPLGGRPTSL